MFDLDSFMGKLTCTYGLVSGFMQGELRSAIDLCLFIYRHEL